MKLKYLALSLLIGTSAVSIAQDDDKNLVQNPGFETIDGKLKKPEQIEVAKHWKSATGEKADLYEEGHKNPLIGTRDNAHGSEDPYEGDHYAGIRAYSYGDKLPRTYLMTELLGPLKKGVQYCVSFKLSLSDKAKYASNYIGAHLSKKPFELEGEESINVETHVMHSKNKTFTGQYSWESVCGVFTAQGGEKFLTLGNFTSNKSIDEAKIRKPQGIRQQTPDAYYYIDDVQVFILDSIQECQCEQEGTEEEEVQVVYTKQVISKKELSMEDLAAASSIYFAKNAIKFSDFAKNELDVLAQRMLEDTSVKLYVIGHMDDEEVEEGKENPPLKYTDQKRVNAVITYLEGKGVSKTRFIKKTKQADEKADTSGSDIGKAKNRRVEFKVL